MQALQKGALFDSRYEIVDVLGAGGFGVVYKARHQQFDRLVAIKSLRTSILEERDGLLRFEREAKVLSNLQHKNIISLHAFGVFDEAPYMVTEFVEGRTLDTLLDRDGHLGWRRATRIIQNVLSALECAHRQGIIHRDLKPSNILVTTATDGTETVKVIDFGLAKLLPGFGVPSQKLTETGFAVGTCYYMSPEQCAGQAVDERSDIYAAGCILHQMLTGRLPFDADDNVAVLYQHLQLQAEPLSKFAHLKEEEACQSLQAFIDKCLAKEPFDRYPSATEALADIDAILSQQFSKFSRYKRKASSKKNPTAKKRRATTGNIIAAALVAISLSAVAAYFLASQRDREISSAQLWTDLQAQLISRGVSVGQPWLAPKEAGDFGPQLIEVLAQANRDYRLPVREHQILHRWVAQYYANQGKFVEAKDCLLQGLKLPAQSTAYFWQLQTDLAHYLDLSGEVGKAETLRKQLLTNPSAVDASARVISDAMYCYEYRDDLKGLNKFCQDALLLELRPLDRTRFEYLLGTLYMLDGDDKAAANCFRAGAKLGPDQVISNPCWLGLTRLAIREGKMEDAENYLANFTYVEPDNGELSYNAAMQRLILDARQGLRPRLGPSIKRIQNTYGESLRAINEYDRSQALKALAHGRFTRAYSRLSRMPLPAAYNEMPLKTTAASTSTDSQ